MIFAYDILLCLPDRTSENILTAQRRFYDASSLFLIVEKTSIVPRRRRGADHRSPRTPDFISQD
jgi:hypothetical protein